MSKIPFSRSVNCDDCESDATPPPPPAGVTATTDVRDGVSVLLEERMSFAALRRVAGGRQEFAEDTGVEEREGEGGAVPSSVTRVPPRVLPAGLTLPGVATAVKERTDVLAATPAIGTSLPPP